MKEPNTELISKIRLLNEKIEELAQVNASIHPEPSKAIPVGFVSSGDLAALEKGITEILSAGLRQKEAVCRALASIDKNRLYVQAGTKSFLQYLSLGRIPVTYKTAKEYATIGKLLDRYREEFDAVRFMEEDGLKKIIFLKNALANHSDKALVFENIKKLSLRDFRNFSLMEDSGAVSPEDGSRPVRTAVRGTSLALIRESGVSRVLLKVDPESFNRISGHYNMVLFMEELKKAADRFFSELTE